MNEEMDNALDQLLRDHAPDPVADDGFCASLTESLPPRKPPIKWPLAVGILAGMLACWLSVGTAPIVLNGWRDWIAGDLTSSALALIVLLVGLDLMALAWVLTDRDEPAF
ncbi:hypothetical protein [Blastomonas sp.]|uniref:hypothetical protein n=1 Tax=Blastomonas sp. TaxID=1909299 RepID=UPI00359436AC